MIDQIIDQYRQASDSVYTLGGTETVYTNDLSCNNITIKTVCDGLAQIISSPPGATIFIDGIRQQIAGIDITTPAIIDHIPCTDPINKPNKFKLTLSGYRDEEGILYITPSNIPTNPYPLNIIMKPVPSDFGLLLLSLAIAGAFLAMMRAEKHKREK